MAVTHGPYAGWVQWTFDSGVHNVPTPASTDVPNGTVALDLYGVRVCNPKTNPNAIDYTLTDASGKVLIATTIQPGATLAEDPSGEPITGLKEFASAAGLVSHLWGHT